MKGFCMHTLIFIAFCLSSWEVSRATALQIIIVLSIVITTIIIKQT